MSRASTVPRPVRSLPGRMAAKILAYSEVSSLYDAPIKEEELLKSKKPSRGYLEMIFERFTDEAMKSVMLAEEETRRIGDVLVGTVKVLVGLLLGPENIAAKVLKSMGIIINAEDVRKEADKIIGLRHGYAVPKEVEKSEIAATDIPFTPDGWRMLELAYQEARKLEHNYIGSGHLLLAFISDERCLAHLVLAKLGANASNIRTEVIRMVGENNNETIVGMKSYQPVVDKVDEELREIENILSQVEEEMIKALDYEDLEKAHNLYSQKAELGREMFVLKAKRANLSMWC